MLLWEVVKHLTLVNRKTNFRNKNWVAGDFLMMNTAGELIHVCVSQVGGHSFELLHAIKDLDEDVWEEIIELKSLGQIACESFSKQRPVVVNTWDNWPILPVEIREHWEKVARDVETAIKERENQ